MWVKHDGVGGSGGSRISMTEGLMAGRVAHRSKVAVAVSLALHGGVVLLLLMIAGSREAPRPPVIELTEIQVVPPPPPPPPPPGPSRSGTRAGAGKSAKAGALGRRGHDALPRSLTRAPAVADPFADLTVSHETPTLPDPGNPAGTTGQGVGTGLFGTGTGAGAGYGSLGDGPGTLQVPPPPPSLARPPRPKSDYSDWNIPGSHEFVNKILVVELTIDPHGDVRDVRVLQGVTNWLDSYASAVARGYKFHPALSDKGEPTPGHLPWTFVIHDNPDDHGVDYTPTDHAIRMAPASSTRIDRSGRDR